MRQALRRIFGRAPQHPVLKGRYQRGECLLCGRALLRTGHTNHNHDVCLWASTCGHAAGFCGCTGYADTYEAGTAYFLATGPPPA